MGFFVFHDGTFFIIFTVNAFLFRIVYQDFVVIKCYLTADMILSPSNPVNCTHKYICFGCYSDCVFSVFLHGIIEAFLLWANLYITFTKWQESRNQLFLIAGLLPLGFSISFTQHITVRYLNTAFCGTWMSFPWSHFKAVLIIMMTAACFV